MDDANHAVIVTIIDLGLSRMDASLEMIHWTPFEQEVFEGEGEYDDTTLERLLTLVARRLPVRYLSNDEGTQRQFMDRISAIDKCHGTLHLILHRPVADEIL